jgi:hypothetical protein
MSAFGGTADIVLSGAPSASVANGPKADIASRLLAKAVLASTERRPSANLAKTESMGVRS